MNSTVRSRTALALALSAVLAAPAHAGDELTELSLEELLDQEVVSASRFSQRASDAPSSVTVLREEDFRTWGWRTLAEALNSVRGFLATNNREFTGASVRGFAAPGDYNTRLLLMIDGIRTNGNLYDQANVGQEFILDLDLIDRVEIVRGPGSMVYGGNAFFGVINVITKAGADLNGTEVAVSKGSYDTRGLRASYGKHLDNGADVLLSASGSNSDGQSLYFPEFGKSRYGTDDEDVRRVFARYRQGDLQLSAIYGKREHGRPSGAFGAVPDDPRNRDWDETLLLDARYQRQFGEHSLVSGWLFYGSVDWRGQYVNDWNGQPYDVDRETGKGRWAGFDGQFHYTGLAGHHLLLGMDYQDNLRQDQFAADKPPSLRCTATGTASEPCTDTQGDSYRLGVYVQDDVALTNSLSLNLGVRHDWSDVASSEFSPRLGLIWKPDAENVVKLLYGKAFRAPNAYERDYYYPGGAAMAANPDLKSETIKTYEAVWERYLGANLRVTAGVYFYQVDDWIVQVDDGSGALQFQNQPRVNGRGLDLEVEKRFANGARLRASYAGQFVPEQPHGVLNTRSRHLVKANFATPLPAAGWHLGLEAQYASGQPTASGHTGSYAIANALLRWQPPAARKTEVSLGVYNLFDRDYAHSLPDDSMYSGIARERIEQDGRTWQVKLIQKF